MPGASGKPFTGTVRYSTMSKRTAKFLSRLTFSHVMSIGITAGILAFGCVAVASAEHSLFWN